MRKWDPLTPLMWPCRGDFRQVVREIGTRLPSDPAVVPLQRNPTPHRRHRTLGWSSGWEGNGSRDGERRKQAQSFPYRGVIEPDLREVQQRAREKLGEKRVHSYRLADYKILGDYSQNRGGEWRDLLRGAPPAQAGAAQFVMGWRPQRGPREGRETEAG